MNKKANQIDIILVGSGADGKTSIVLRYMENIFISNYLSTLGIDSKLKKVKMENGSEIKVKIVDTAGQERFRSIAKNYIKKVNGIIVNYDITDKNSFSIADSWINEIKNDSSLKEKPIFLVGNKSDLEDIRKISKEEGEQLAKKYGIMFSECSAKTGENVDYIFNELIKKCYPLIKNAK